MNSLKLKTTIAFSTLLAIPFIAQADMNHGNADVKMRDAQTDAIEKRMEKASNYDNFWQKGNLFQAKSYHHPRKNFNLETDTRYERVSVNPFILNAEEELDERRMRVQREHRSSFIR